MTAPRFVQDDCYVIDSETSLRVGFIGPENARLTAEWLNSGNATVSDYPWVS